MPSWPTTLDLIADGVEDPRNLAALRSAAAMFRVGCHFVAGSARQAATIQSAYDRIIVLEQDDGAGSLFDYRLPRGRIALVVGNERRGVGGQLRRVEDERLVIPMRGAGVQSLNVAAAAGVALSQLLLAGAAGRGRRSAGRRPDIVLVDPLDPAQTGSSLRTAWAFGWNRVDLVDRHGVWFTGNRVAFAEGRGGARRHRNPIRVVGRDDAVPTGPITVVTLQGDAPSFWRDRASMGARTVVIPDERAPGALALIDQWEHADAAIRRVGLRLPVVAAANDFRVVTAIVLAEIARRIGWTGSEVRRAT